MPIFDAQKYVDENASVQHVGFNEQVGKSIRCISDRASAAENKDHPIAIPGSGLGLVMDVLGAATLLRRGGTHVELGPEEVIGAVQRAISVINFHTDEKSVKNKGLPCGGCGH